jgi:hypothetical protein
MFRVVIVLSAVLTFGLLGCHNNSSTGNNDMGNMPSQSPDMTPPNATDDMANASGDMMNTGPAQSLVSGGVLEAVSHDQTMLAYLPSPTSVNGNDTGALVVSPLPVTGQNTAVANNAYHAFFPGTGTINALFYSTGPTASVDAGSTAVYGAINVWKPGTNAGIQLSTGFATISTTAQDNSSVLFWDTATASNQGTGKVMLARVTDCTANACTPQSLATGVTVYEMAISFDGKYGAYSVKNAGATVSYAVNLVTIATGAVTTIATAGSSGTISFSSDSKLLASIGPAGALQVTTTATGKAATWGAMPAGSQSLYLAFADSTTLLVRGQDAGATMLTIYKTTAAAAASPVMSGPGTLTLTVPRNSRYLFTSMTPANGIGDVEAYDFTAAAPTAIPVATAGAVSSVALSPDGTYARVLESYDRNAHTGTLTIVALSAGTATTVQAGITLSSPSFVAMHELMYIDNANAGTLTTWTDGNSTTYATSVNAYRGRSSTIYFSIKATDTMYGYAPGIYATPL